jgi:hypothetical protein
VKVVQIRPDAFQVTAARRELGALVAAARMAVDVMRADPHAPKEAISLLEGVLADWDAAIARGERDDAG